VRRIKTRPQRLIRPDLSVTERKRHMKTTEKSSYELAEGAPSGAFYPHALRLAICRRYPTN
jgi:hypothetical protein